MIAVVASMDREVSGLRKALQEGSPMSSQEVPVLIHVTGVGKERALAGVKALLDRPARLNSILSMGFAGALREGLDAGDLVISGRVYDGGMGGVLDCDANLLSIAKGLLESSSALRYFIADSLTVPRMVCTRAEKTKLARATSAWAVSMEDYWIGTAAIERGIPFLSVRSVLDSSDQDVPPFVAHLGDMGALKQGLTVAARGLTRPWEVPRIAGLSRQVTKAQDSLTAFGLSFATRMAEERSYASL